MKRYLFIVFLLCLHTSSFAQDNPANKKRPGYKPEEQSDPYVPNSIRKSAPGYFQKSNVARSSTASTITTVQVNVDPAGLNMLGDAANEPSMAINPLNPSQVIIGWRQFDNVISNFRQAGWAYSTDAGATWNNSGPLEPGVFRSDPVLDANASGEIFYNSLTSSPGPIFSCKVFSSSTGGATWSQGTDAFGGDKQWMVIDRTGGPGNGNIYSFWTSFYSSCNPGSFTRSEDNNNSYDSCSIVDGDPALGTMAISNTGDVYICGSSSFGNLVVSKTTNAQIQGSVIAWEPGVNVYMDGDISFNANVNPVGILGQANIDVDISNGPGEGNVYVFATVARQSIFDPGDAMFAKSTDGGQTWSFPMRINTDSTSLNTQWMGAMSVAPNGRIDIVWLDTRDEPLPGSNYSSLYYSYSVDQGNTWSANESLSPVFDPHAGYPNQDKMGDYFDMISDNTGAHLAWANTLNGEQDVYYSYIIPQVISGISTIASATNCMLIPNPVSSGTFVVAGNNKVFDLEIFNTQGMKIMESSSCTLSTQMDISNQSAGLYYVKVTYADKSSVVKKLVKL